ncbi:uncharacterized protein Pyn_21482 [Prunus yedoensis var. nudiflora]|uniref:Uncharacterized protein n=1 Tax=Prunus yedoensis var. nudiflora TaxID=2094558 RepID=A0A314YKK8_PRUYE|nr:uncharacterized protein Pyn_21482 [Prunus yedoensis var. nudiflora]
MASRLADFEAKELDFNLVMRTKAKELQGIVQEVEPNKQTLIEEYDREMKSNEQKLGSIQKLVLEYSNAFESKIKDFNLLESGSAMGGGALGEGERRGWLAAEDEPPSKGKMGKTHAGIQS